LAADGDAQRYGQIWAVEGVSGVGEGVVFDALARTPERYDLPDRRRAHAQADQSEEYEDAAKSGDRSAAGP
jgi:hypothetical protein